MVKITVDIQCSACGKDVLKLTFSNNSVFTEPIKVKCGKCSAVMDVTREGIERFFATAEEEEDYEKQDVGVLYGAPQTEVSKKKLFHETFRLLSGEDNNEVGVEKLLAGLVATGRFDLEEARRMLNQMSREGRVYERRPGFWAMS